MAEEIELYRCTECGKASVSIGYLHAHIEGHLGWGPFNMLPPPFPGNFDALMEKTEVIRVTEYELADEPKPSEPPLFPRLREWIGS